MVLYTNGQQLLFYFTMYLTIKIEHFTAITTNKSGGLYETAAKIANLSLFGLSHYFFYFRYHTFHHAFNACFQGNHRRGTTRAGAL